MTENEAINLLARLESAFDKRLSDGARIEYLIKMVGWDLESGEFIVEKAIEECRFFPKIADLVGFLPAVDSGKQVRYRDGIDWRSDLGKRLEYRNERIRNLPLALYNAFILLPEVEQSYEKAFAFEFANAQALHKDPFDYFFIEHEPGMPTREQVWLSRAQAKLGATLAGHPSALEKTGRGKVSYRNERPGRGDSPSTKAAGGDELGEESGADAGPSLGDQMQAVGAHLTHYTESLKAP